MEHARQCLADAEWMRTAESYKSSANRVYYAVFHAMRAVLILDGFDSKKHSGIIAEFQRLISKQVHSQKKHPESYPQRSISEPTVITMISISYLAARLMSR